MFGQVTHRSGAPHLFRRCPPPRHQCRAASMAAKSTCNVLSTCNHRATAWYQKSTRYSVLVSRSTRSTRTRMSPRTPPKTRDAHPSHPWHPPRHPLLPCFSRDASLALAILPSCACDILPSCVLMSLRPTPFRDRNRSSHARHTTRYTPPLSTPSTPLSTAAAKRTFTPRGGRGRPVCIKRNARPPRNLGAAGSTRLHEETG